jgi:hypothetical protein
MEICVDDPIATPNVMSCCHGGNETKEEENIVTIAKGENKAATLTNLFFMANIMALACSAAFPTIGSRITLIKATGKFNESDAPCLDMLKKARGVSNGGKQRTNGVQMNVTASKLFST